MEGFDKFFPIGEGLAFGIGTLPLLPLPRPAWINFAEKSFVIFCPYRIGHQGAGVVEVPG
jgi:hypothetical protein